MCTDPVSSTGDFDSVVKCYEEKYQDRNTRIEMPVRLVHIQYMYASKDGSGTIM